MVQARLPNALRGVTPYAAEPLTGYLVSDPRNVDQIPLANVVARNIGVRLDVPDFLLPDLLTGTRQRLPHVGCAQAITKRHLKPEGIERDETIVPLRSHLEGDPGDVFFSNFQFHESFIWTQGNQLLG